jgi:hypothetical protein
MAGMCTPIPANTDPAKECVAMAPLVDGGAMPEGGTVDAASDSGAILDGAAGVGFNLPEGGVTQDDTICVGACNGQRACTYPGSMKTCGTQFCNTTAQSGRFACDGTGHCTLDLENCTDYACVGTACGSSCSQVTDCLSTSYCTNMGVCAPQLANGMACTLGNQCASGNCVQSVCCSSACTILGGTCTAPGSVGECKCSLSCGDGGSCQLFYRDADGDGYGDKQGTLANGNAVVGCSGAPPTGFVADNTDCDDHDVNAHPGQTAYYSTPSTGVGTFDYNCDGTLEKGVTEYPGAYCTFCGTPTASCPTQSGCTSSGETASLSCAESIYPCGGFPIFRLCTGCGVFRTSGFTSTVPCGQSATYTQCGTCSAAGGAPGTATYSSMTQTCH